MDIIQRSLDNDLIEAQRLYDFRSDVLLLLQIVRLLRGKPLPVVEMPVKGWSPDGKTWYPSEPGTFTSQEL